MGLDTGVVAVMVVIPHQRRMHAYVRVITIHLCIWRLGFLRLFAEEKSPLIVFYRSLPARTRLVLTRRTGKFKMFSCRAVQRRAGPAPMSAQHPQFVSASGLEPPTLFTSYYSSVYHLLLNHGRSGQLKTTIQRLPNKAFPHHLSPTGAFCACTTGVITTLPRTKRLQQ